MGSIAVPLLAVRPGRGCLAGVYTTLLYTVGLQDVGDRARRKLA